VKHGETGWLVPAGDVDALVDALKACLAATPEALGEMGRQGRLRALARHDARTEAGRLAAHIAALPGAPGARA